MQDHVQRQSGNAPLLHRQTATKAYSGNAKIWAGPCRLPGNLSGRFVFAHDGAIQFDARHTASNE